MLKALNRKQKSTSPHRGQNYDDLHVVGFLLDVGDLRTAAMFRVTEEMFPFSGGDEFHNTALGL